MSDRHNRLIAGAVMASVGTGITLLVLLGWYYAQGAGGLVSCLAVLCCICVMVSAAIRKVVRHEFLWGVLSFVASYLGYVVAYIIFLPLVGWAQNVEEVIVLVLVTLLIGVLPTVPLTIGCVWGVAIAIPRANTNREEVCASCGYDLRGADHAVCPECGVATMRSGSGGDSMV